MLSGTLKLHTFLSPVQGNETENIPFIYKDAHTHTHTLADTLSLCPPNHETTLRDVQNPDFTSNPSPFVVIVLSARALLSYSMLEVTVIVLSSPSGSFCLLSGSDLRRVSNISKTLSLARAKAS